MTIRLTPQQKQVIDQLKANKNWLIRYAVSYGRTEVCFWGAPVLRLIDFRVFDSLRAKRLIEMEKPGNPEYWQLSKLAQG